MKMIALVAAFLAAPFFVVVVSVVSGQPLSLERVSLQILLISVVFYPVCEEIFFRGFIQRELLNTRFAQKQWKGVSIANLLSNFLFASAHLVVVREINTAYVFIPGLIFGYFFERHRGLTYPILLHGWYNLVALLSPALW